VKLFILIVSVIVLILWVGCLLLFLGHIPLISDEFLKISLPSTAAELGDTFGVVNGIFSGVAVVLALVAILIQGKELKASTRAQNEQAKALDETVKLNALALRLQYLLSEVERMDRMLKDISGDSSKANLFDHGAEKKAKFLKEAREIDKRMQSLI
jgi:hypothetical protein